MLYRTYRSGTIKVQTPKVTCNSSTVQQRLERIADNYRQLEQLLTEVELQFPSQPAVAEVEGAEGEGLSRRLSRRRPR